MTFIFKGIKNKKGNAVVETLVFFVLLFVIALSWLTISYIQSEINDDIQLDDTLRTENKQLNQDLTDRAPNVFDGLILFFLIIFWILVLVASYMIDTHPAFFIVSFLLLIFVFITVVFMANAFNEIFTQDLLGLSASFPLTFFIFNNLLVISIVMGLTVLFIMYAKLR